MELQKQVVSLELAKKLKELGVKQESLFFWKQDSWPDKLGNIHHGEAEIRTREKLLNNDEPYSAFTVAELGALLPESIEIDNEIFGEKKENYIELSFQNVTKQVNDSYGVEQYRLYRASVGLKKFDEKNEADARAKLLIYLLENALIPAQK